VLPEAIVDEFLQPDVEYPPFQPAENGSRQGIRTDSDDMWEDQQWSGEENWSGAGNDASWWGGSEYGGAAFGDYRGDSSNFWHGYPDGYPHPFVQGDPGERKPREERKKFS
jgi:hypothetical protein